MTEGANHADAVQAAVATVFRDDPERLRRVCVAQLYDSGLHDEADDIVAAAVLEVLTKLPRGVENWEAYLVTVVQRRAIDFVRSAAVRRRDGREAELDIYPDDRSPIEMVEDGIDTMRDMQRVEDALVDLDHIHREVARETLWRGRKQSDVAAELGITQARVSQILAAAKREIREALEGGHDEEERRRAVR
jgi:RNA polymerase sigma factor (sigma-70 family)